MVAYLLCYVLLVPAAALVLGIGLLVSRTLADLRACLVGVLALVGSVLLLGPAENAGLEVFVATRGPALDRLALDVRAYQAAQVARGMTPDSAWLERANHFAPRTRALGVSSGTVRDGMVVFVVEGGRNRQIVYAFGGRIPACRGERLRFLGGRWFENRCPNTVYTD